MGYRRTYRQTAPHWVTARYAGKSQDGTAFRAGERVLYFPSSRTILCGETAEQHMRDQDAADQDEAFYQSQY